MFFSFSSFAQSADPYGFPVKTSFVLGESHTYEVKEFDKLNNKFFMLKHRSEIESTVNFQVVDTAEGGYWIQYSVSINSVKQRKDSAAYVTASLMDGMQLMIYAKDGEIQLDSTTYYNTKKRIAENLDSIVAKQFFGKKITQFITNLQSNLKKDAGLGSLLGPLSLFKVYYSSGVYKKFRLTTDGRITNILDSTLFNGLIEKQWMSTSKNSTIKLNCLFTGAPVAAANYLKSVYKEYFAKNNIKVGKYFFPSEIRYIIDYDFQTRPGKSFPSYLFKKNVSEHDIRSVNKIEMKETTTVED